MSRQDEFKRTIPHGDNALSLIKRNKVPAVPRNYELWYTYSTSFNDGLNKAVNALLRENGGLTASDIDTLYEKFLSQRRLGERIDDVSNQVADEISHIVEIIETSLSEAGTYQNSLEGANAKLVQSTDFTQLRAIVRDLIVANHEHAETNGILQKRLETSKRQIDELQSSLEMIRFESLTDELTTLANRKHFDKSLENALAEADENAQALALLITDIDHFKKFNDTYGHQTGDQVLRLVALAVKQNVKGRDIPCRYGGEEFAIILPNTQLHQAVTVAEHIRKAVMTKELIKRSTGENLGQVSISIGAAAYRSGEGADALIERTDRCLYAAKRAGRNRVICETDPEAVQLGKNVA